MNQRKQWIRRRGWLLGATLAISLLAARHGVAQVGVGGNNAECCLLGGSASSAFLNPAVGEDKRFFTGPGGAVNLVLALMRPKRMLELPLSLFELRTPGTIDSVVNNGFPLYTPILDPVSAAAGCQNTYLDSLRYFHPTPMDVTGTAQPTWANAVYNPANAYASPERSYQSTLAETSSGIPDLLFRNDSYYNFLEWTHRCESGDGNCKPKTLDLACTDGGAGAPLSLTHNACRNCLLTKGYWLNASVEPWKNQNTSGTFAGRWLNFYPPKYLVMRMALKTVLRRAFVDGFRIAAFTTEGGNGAEVLNTSSGGSTVDLHPPCGNTGAPNKNHVGNSITNMTFLGDNSNPMGEVLANIGQYLSRNGGGHWSQMISGNAANSSPVKTGGNINYFHDDDNNRPHCNQCQRHFVLMFADGRGDEGNPSCPNIAGVTTPPCLLPNQCAVEGMGTEQDGNDWIKDDPAFGQTTISGAAIRTTPVGTCDRDYADDVARFLFNTDTYPNGTLIPITGGVADTSRQYVFTYTVGVGSNFNNRQTILQQMAAAGGGSFYPGKNYAQMVSSLEAAFEDINRRANSFSSTSVNQLQTTSGSTAFVPRFRPQSRSFWNGYLYRWGVFNEFVEDRDLNTDGDKNDVLLVQRTTCTPGPTCPARADIVQEDLDGNFILPYVSGTPPATPWWEAGQVLKTADSSTRNIYTVVDTSGDGKITSADSMVPFTAANSAQLLPYLGLTGTTTCTNFSVLVGDPLLATDLDRCAKVLINWVRGRELGLNIDRDWLLGDIFHSSPVMSDIPAKEMLCDIGIISQCARTLYAQDLPLTPTPLTSGYTGGGTNLNAYQEYRRLKKTRKRIVLVGANDGMLHAFDAGDAIVPEPVPTPTNPLPDTHTIGTGRELWAFVPTDQLSKLRLFFEGGHNYYVDGDIMVRDIWEDTTGAAPNQKEEPEFHTVAVVSERRGGNHYFALDVTDPLVPRLRWMFPQPCSTESYEVGETWMHLLPKPPPIGPVLLEKTGGIARNLSGVGTRDTEERWVVALQGGYDPNHVRGQGIWMLDVWTGNIIWEAKFDAADTRYRFMRHPIAAPVAMVDYGGGTSTQPAQDGFFDTAVVGDVGGQVWMARLYAPGILSVAAPAGSSSSTNRVGNWFAARAFEQQSASSPDDEPDGTGGTAADYLVKNPIFFIASNAVQPDNGWLRTFVGAGDRYNLRDSNAGTCRADSPHGCAKYNCDYQGTLTTEYGGRRLQSHIHYDDKKIKHFQKTITATASNACTLTTAQQTVQITDCPGGLNPGLTKDRNVSCSGTGAAYTCAATAALFDNTDRINNSFNETGLVIPRYYGFVSYGKTGRTFLTQAEADTYDSTRFNDASLVDATAFTPLSAGAAKSGNGWLLRYASFPERTASGAGIIASCVLWNSLVSTISAVSTCSTSGSNTATLYQSDFVTGKPDCASSFNGARALTRNVISPPPELGLAISISKTGEVKYQAQGFELGSSQATTQDVSVERDPVQMIYSIDVPQDLHRCKHGTTGCP